MLLRAEYHEGFSTNLLSWSLEASQGTAIVDARWFSNGIVTERIIEMEFPVSRIQSCANVLSGLQANYDGGMDDVPRQHLTVITESQTFSTRVRMGTRWSIEEKREVDAFMSVWRPIFRDVKTQLVFPPRDSTVNRS